MTCRNCSKPIPASDLHMLPDPKVDLGTGATSYMPVCSECYELLRFHPEQAALTETPPKAE